MAIPIANPKAQNQALKEEMMKAIEQVFDNCQFILGENVKLLEEEAPKLCDAKYGITVNSGTDALIIGLAACGVGPGDEVITTPFTFVATVEAIMVVGAKPVFCDIDYDTFNIDPDRLEEKITDKTKAILPVHLYGQCADISRVEAIAKKHNVRLLSDGAQAIGSKHKDKGIGAYGDASTLSFFPTKNLGGCGDGGMVLTDSEEIDQLARSYRFHGMNKSYRYERVGYCSRMDEVQAAMLRVKLKHITEWNNKRRDNAHYYIENLSDLPIKLPVAKPENYHTYHQFTIRFAEKRDEVKQLLNDSGVSAAVYYPSPLHLEKAYLSLGYKEGDFPEAEKATREVLSLPVIPELSKEQVEEVAATVRQVVEKD